MTELQSWKQEAEQQRQREAEARRQRAESAERSRQLAEADREQRHEAQLAALQQRLDTVVTSAAAEKEEALRREVALRKCWEDGRTQDRERDAAAWAERMQEVRKEIADVAERSAQLAKAQQETQRTLLQSLNAHVTEAAEAHERRLAEAEEAARRQAEFVSQQLTSLEEEIGSVRASLDACNEESTALQDKAADMDGRLGQLKGESEQLLLCTGDLSARWKRLESELVESRRAVKEEVQEVRARLAQALQLIAQLQSEQQETAAKAGNELRRQDDSICQVRRSLELVILRSSDNNSSKGSVDEQLRMLGDTEQDSADLSSHPLDGLELQGRRQLHAGFQRGRFSGRHHRPQQRVSRPVWPHLAVSALAAAAAAPAASVRLQAWRPVLCLPFCLV